MLDILMAVGLLGLDGCFSVLGKGTKTRLIPTWKSSRILTNVEKHKWNQIFSIFNNYYAIILSKSSLLLWKLRKFVNFVGREHVNVVVLIFQRIRQFKHIIAANLRKCYISFFLVSSGIIIYRSQLKTLPKTFYHIKNAFEDFPPFVFLVHFVFSF